MVYYTQKTTFAETVAFALGQETARTISRPQVSKVRQMEVVVKEENGQKAKLKCFNFEWSLPKYLLNSTEKIKIASPSSNKKLANY